MRAAVIYQHGGPDAVRFEERYPEPTLEPGFVIIRVRACALNFHDIFSRRGMPGIRLPLPLIIGSDIAGEVVEGDTNLPPGTRVLVDPLLPARGMIGERWDGGRAEYCLAHASQLIPVPDTVSFEAAASIPLAYATAHRMMITRGEVKASDTVLVMGASGGVGTASVLLAKMHGATVIACASSGDKLSRLAELGADHGINYTSEDMRTATWELVGKPRITGEGGVSLLVNCTGGGTWIESSRCMAVGARLVTCGATAGFEEQVDVRYTWTFEHSLIGSNGWRRSDIVAMLQLAADGRLEPVIDQVLPLEEVHRAEQLMEQRKLLGKIVLTP